jgi:hypothetical protein
LTRLAGSGSSTFRNSYFVREARDRAPADDFREEGLAYAGIADKDRTGPLGDELQIEQS